MKKTIFSVLMALVLVLTTASTVFADEYVDDISNDAHKIRNKWDAVGTFTSGRDLPTSTVGSFWTYEVHIKEAMYSPYSKGVITFESGSNIITAHIEDVKLNYAYWAGVPGASENLAAVGWADYNGTIYNFMFIYSEGGIWIILSNYSYDTLWAAGTVYPNAQRAAQLLSNPWWPDLTITQLEFGAKEIH